MKKFLLLCVVALMSGLLYADSTTLPFPVADTDTVGGISVMSTNVTTGVDSTGYTYSYSSSRNLPPFLKDFQELGEDEGFIDFMASFLRLSVGLLIAVFLFLFFLFVVLPVLIIVFIIKQISKTKRAKYEYMQEAARNGVPVTPAVGSTAATPQTIPSGAITLTALGAGFFLMGLSWHFAFLGGVGLLLACIGAGKIIIFYLSQPSTPYTPHYENSPTEEPINRDQVQPLGKRVPSWAVICTVFGVGGLLLGLLSYNFRDFAVIAILLICVGGSKLLLHYLPQQGRRRERETLEGITPEEEGASRNTAFMQAIPAWAIILVVFGLGLILMDCFLRVSPFLMGAGVLLACLGGGNILTLYLAHRDRNA